MFLLDWTVMSQGLILAFCLLFVVSPPPLFFLGGGGFSFSLDQSVYLCFCLSFCVSPCPTDGGWSEDRLYRTTQTVQPAAMYLYEYQHGKERGPRKTVFLPWGVVCAYH